MIDFHSHSPQPLVPVSFPSSFDALPQISIPTKSEVIRVERIKRSIVQKCGIEPGTYSELTPELHEKIEAVYASLMHFLLDELSGVDAFDLCIRLYDRNEEYLGYLFRAHYLAATKRAVLGSTESSMPIELLWERLSPYTESIRWLIEICLKYCDMQGQQIRSDKFDRIIELARALFDWDGTWEQIYRNVIDLQLVIGPDFSTSPELTQRTDRVRRAYQHSLMPTMAENENEEFRRFQDRRNDLTAEKAGQEITNALESMGLDDSLRLERGYGLSDWGRFYLGLLDSFSQDEYRKVIKLTSLESFLSSKWRLDREQVSSLLMDFGLSKETVQDIDIKRFRPVEFGRRDTRLLRRPVVVLERGGSVRCLYGIETLTRGQYLVLGRLESGRIDLLRENSNRDLRKAVGRLQKEKGGIFEQNVIEECRARGYECSPEKDRVKGGQIPQGSGFGPVDVFIVDRTHRRFVLVEAKNVDDEGSLPKEMQRERNDFSRFVSKLGSQVEWFCQRLPDLKLEHKIPGDEPYSVEGVIVVNSPRIWMFTYEEPVPIQDFFGFFRCLEQGKKFVIEPVVPRRGNWA